MKLVEQAFRSCLPLEGNSLRTFFRTGDNSVLFFCRLQIIKTQHHVEALVEHCSGQVVVSASTREWAIKKHLYSTRNMVAYESIGRVLAKRCLEAGINFVVYQPTPWDTTSHSVI